MNGGRRGFTLVELLVAMGASSVILASLYTMLYGTARSLEEVKTRSNRLSSARLCLEKLERDLERSIPLKTEPFSGSESTLTIPTVLDLGTRRAVGLVVYESNGNGDWVRRWKALSPNDADAEVQGEENLPGSIKEIRFSYAVKEGGSDKEAWTGHWKADGSVPECVGVSLVVQADDKNNEIPIEKTFTILYGTLPR